MKTNFTLLIIFLFPLWLNCQSSPFTYNKTDYYWGDSSNTLNTIQSFIKVADTLYMAIGLMDKHNDQRYVLVKADLEGNEIKKEFYGSPGFNMPIYPANSLIMDEDSNFVLCARYDEKSSGDIDGYLIRFNRKLEVIWTKRLNIPDSLAGCKSGENSGNYYLAIQVCRDGNYIVSGKYYMNCNGGNLRGYIEKIDTLGNVLWRKVYDHVSGIFDIAVTPDSGFVFPDFYNGYHINRTDKYGNIIWREKVNNEDHFRSGAITINRAGEIVSFAPYVYANPNQWTYYKGINIVKYDMLGNKLLDRKHILYLDIECPGLHQGFELECLDNDDIIIAATTYTYYDFDTTQYGYQGVLFKMNSQGDSLWSRFYNYGELKDECQFNDLVMLEDGGFLAAGYHGPYSQLYNWGAWLVRTDSTGMAPGGYTTGIDELPGKENEVAIQVYPNPAERYISFDVSRAGAGKKFSLIIMDVTGKVHKSIWEVSGIREIDISNLTAGVYFYILEESETGQRHRGKFLKL